MLTIKDGEYIRTKDGHIGKIVKCMEKDKGFKKIPYYEIDFEYTMPMCFPSYSIYGDLIAKHSENIIDLIKKGDFVNNRQVLQVFIDPFTKKKRLLLEGTEVNWQGDMSNVYCEAENIKSVITKEQIESIKYEV